MQYITSDLAKVLGITTNTIRRYEESGFLAPIRDESNYRSYNEFDITKAAYFRLYGKCGFSHNEISTIIDNTDDNIINIYQNKLNELDTQIDRLQRLRHWLKDNQKMLNTAKILDNEYIFMKCPPMKYILFSAEDKLLSEPKRLEAIKTFMYDAPEVQLIQVYKKNADGLFNATPFSGWAIKNVDIPKFNLTDFIDNCPYVEDYAQTDCLYYVHRIPSNIIYDTEAVNNLKLSDWEKVDKYMKDNNYTINGDVVEFFVNVIGDTVTLMDCIPYIVK